MKRFILLAAIISSAGAYASENEYPKNSVIVVATPGYEWAAQDISKVLGVRAVARDIAFIDAAEIAKENENVLGVVEIEINLGQFYETVYAICRDNDGKEVWRVKRMLNFGGGADKLARDMVQGLMTKVKGKKCP